MRKTGKGWYDLKPFSSYGGIKGRSSKGEFNFSDVSQQATQMDEDANRFSKEVTPNVPGEEGLKDMIVVDAVYESMRSGGKVWLEK